MVSTFTTPPVISPLGSAAIPPIPNPIRPVNETVRLSEATDRAQARVERKSYPEMGKRKRGMHPVLKIFLESVLVFGLCLLLYFIIRGL
jgi:hypothetical protein